MLHALLLFLKHILNQIAKFVLIMHLFRAVFIIRAGSPDKVIPKKLNSELVNLSKS